jgi:hypothetical protein
MKRLKTLLILIRKIKQIFKRKNKKENYSYLDDIKSEYGYDEEFFEDEELFEDEEHKRK